ncbi:EPIDERMAL PATTERNING FACTOR-like protein 3 [Striga hermonthica]|uniref:Epidermal patterning factor-like protein n=1 Tax=Striga hermonthica TaxID=68872 RepID=A0A9N7RC90_STRHE|nr:EPIDERMAL PATTERNING FACTOR-like protein 3 [Striga hermonthica]
MDFAGPNTIQNHQSLKINHKSNEVKGIVENTSKYKEMKKMGSRPPSCEHKCYGCMPCEAIQVPTTNRVLGPQYTNYEPEGWKCKCGPTFYSP